MARSKQNNLNPSLSNYFTLSKMITFRTPNQYTMFFQTKSWCFFRWFWWEVLPLSTSWSSLWRQSRFFFAMEPKVKVWVCLFPIEQMSMSWSLSPSRYEGHDLLEQTFGTCHIFGEWHHISLHLRPKIFLANCLSNQRSSPRMISTYTFMNLSKYVICFFKSKASQEWSRERPLVQNPLDKVELGWSVPDPSCLELVWW